MTQASSTGPATRLAPPPLPYLYFQNLVGNY